MDGVYFFFKSHENIKEGKSKLDFFCFFFKTDKQ